MINDNYTKFSINENTRMFLITNGEYNGTQYKYKDVQLENGELKFLVEFNEFWLGGGKVTNPRESELNVFVDTVATEIMKNIIIAINANKPT